ncbi:MAG TPA: BrnT family toxin [Bauldia sp.]|nr:BrnT family toxin [Bauldia sp.]
MTDVEDIGSLIARIRAFGWHEKKREANLRIHNIDFADLKGIFDGYTLIRRSDRHGETRYQVFGYVHGQEVAVAFTIRSDVCWLISARRARRDERRRYYDRFEGRPPAGKD